MFSDTLCLSHTPIEIIVWFSRPLLLCWNYYISHLTLNSGPWVYTCHARTDTWCVVEEQWRGVLRGFLMWKKCNWCVVWSANKQDLVDWYLQRNTARFVETFHGFRRSSDLSTRRCYWESGYVMGAPRCVQVLSEMFSRQFGLRK